MNCRKDCLGQRGFVRQSPTFEDAEGAPEQRLGCDGSEANDYPRLEELDLRLEPRQAGANFSGVWSLVDAAFAPCVLRPFEVLHGVCDVDILARDAGRVEGAVEKLARGPHERPSGFVLGVSRLLSDDDDLGVARTFTEDRLRAELVEVAPATSGGRGPQLWQRRARRDEISG